MNKQINISSQQLSQQQKEDLIKSFLYKKKLQLGKKLGQGSFAEVFEAIQIDQNRKVAIKVLSDLDYKSKFEDEKIAMYQIQGQQYAIQIITDLANEDLGYNAIVMEYCDCTLTEIFEKNKDQFSFEQLKALTYQLLKGLQTFQEKGIIHADLKPDNILFNQEKNRFLISDFGLSKILERPELEQLLSKHSKITGGNFKYVSPEIITQKKPFTIKIDVFSIGLILLEFLLKRELTSLEWFKLKSDGLFQIIPQLKQHQYNSFINDILSKMVCHESVDRLDSMKLLQKLAAYKPDEQLLKSLQFQNKKIIQSNQLIEINKEITIQNSNTLNKLNTQKDIQLSSIKLVEKKLLKTIEIKPRNLKQLQNLNNYQEAKFFFEEALVQTYCFCFKKYTLDKLVEGIKKIQQSTSIISLFLDLRHNMINSEGAKRIASALENYQNINQLSLDLWGNYIGHEGAKSISNTLKNYQNINQLSLNLWDNNIGSEGAKSIASALENYQNINQLSLDLWSNNIGSEGAKSIVNALQNYQNINQLSLDLRLNNISQEQKELLENSLRSKFGGINPKLLLG